MHATRSCTIRLVCAYTRANGSNDLQRWHGSGSSVRQSRQRAAQENAEDAMRDPRTSIAFSRTRKIKDLQKLLRQYQRAEKDTVHEFLKQQHREHIAVIERQLQALKTESGQ